VSNKRQYRRRWFLVFPFLIVVLVFDFGFASTSAHIQKPMKNETALLLIDIERSLFDAIRKKDIDALSKIVADDFVFREPGRAEAGKADFLKSVKSFPLEILDIWSDNMAVSIFGDVALLTGVQNARTRGKNGKDELSAGAFTDLFVKRGGQWLLVVAHNVELRTTNPRDNQLVSNDREDHEEKRPD
jgi:ketosteroid isomerase-like protein